MRELSEIAKSNPELYKFLKELAKKNAENLKDIVKITLADKEVLKYPIEIVLASEDNIDKYLMSLELYFQDVVYELFYNPKQIFLDLDDEIKWIDYLNLETLIKFYEWDYEQACKKAKDEGKEIKESFEEFFIKNIFRLLKESDSYKLKYFEGIPIVIKFRNKLYGDINTWKVHSTTSDTEELNYYLKIDENNLIYLHITGTVKKNDKVLEKDTTLPVFQIHACERIYDPIDKRELYYISGWKLHGSEEKFVEIIDVKDVGVLLSSPVISLCKKNTELYMELKNTLKMIIEQLAEKKLKTLGFAIVNKNGHLTILECYKLPDTVFCEEIKKIETLVLNKKVDDILKEDLIKNLATFNKVHNLITIGAFFASHLIHIIKNNKFVPHTFIYGDSGVGKTSLAMLLSYVVASASQTTIHQIAKKISGFRCGICYFDEKIQYSSELTQMIKLSGSNYGLVERTSHNKNYIANVVFLASSNPKPKFSCRGLADFEGLLRRAVFLKVEKEKDEIDRELAKASFEVLDLYREELIKTLLDGLQQFTVKEIEEIYNYFSTLKEKYRLLFTGIELWKRICERYNITLDIDYTEILNRLQESEKEMYGFGEISLIETIQKIIMEDSLNVARIVTTFDEISDVIETITKKNVVKAMLSSKGYALYKSSNGDLYYVFTVSGFKNFSKVNKEIPELDNSKDIQNYLKQNNIEFEYKRCKIAGMTIRGFFIKADIEIENELSCEVCSSTERELEEKILQIIEDKGEVDLEELKEELNIDENRLLKIINKLKNLGDIREVKFQVYTKLE